MKRILVALDGSPFSERAVPVANELAAAAGADVALVRVVVLVAPGDHEPGLISYLDEHRVAIAQEYIATQAARITTGRVTQYEAVAAKDAATGLLGKAREWNADIIIVASHGDSWPAPTRIGSVAAALLYRAPCPVLVVGPGVAAAVTA